MLSDGEERMEGGVDEERHREKPYSPTIAGCIFQTHSSLSFNSMAPDAFSSSSLPFPIIPSLLLFLQTSCPFLPTLSLSLCSSAFFSASYPVLNMLRLMESQQTQLSLGEQANTAERSKNNTMGLMHFQQHFHILVLNFLCFSL